MLRAKNGLSYRDIGSVNVALNAALCNHLWKSTQLGHPNLGDWSGVRGPAPRAENGRSACRWMLATLPLSDHRVPDAFSSS
jgi:hypothetical protein